MSDPLYSADDGDQYDVLYSASSALGDLADDYSVADARGAAAHNPGQRPWVATSCGAAAPR